MNPRILSPIAAAALLAGGLMMAPLADLLAEGAKTVATPAPPPAGGDAAKR